MWLDDKPTRVHATPESVKQDYEILKQNLPIPIGIDHLDDKTLNQNPILKKMNLLNVGSIDDVKLEDNAIRITESKITNPTVQELYDNGELTDFSFVSDMYTDKCKTGLADAVEKYSVINRVDFVEKGACKECKVDYNNAQASVPQRAQAKAIFKGDGTMADGNGNPDQNAGDQNSPDGSDAEPTMQDVLNAIQEQNNFLKSSITAIEGALKIKAVPQDGQPPATPTAQPAAPAQAGDATPDDENNNSEPAAASDATEQRIIKLEKEVKAQKALAAKAQAASVVDGYLKEGKVKPADVENHIALAMDAEDKYKAIMDTAPVVIDMERHSRAEAGSSDDEEDIDLDKSMKTIDAAIGKKED